jgi:cellulose synthase/poly-beta-1,6-N-acetylglucosamine synthase-like glycosyltransferase
VQDKVRIYHDDTILTWCQDVEFSIYGSLYQAARSRLHVAGMGGNGQFNRLAALVDVDDGNGPWQHTLTEDQDIGLRFITHGWHTAHVNTVCVHQQGVPHLRRLLRQRTRWAQGNLQAVAHLPSVLRSRLGWFTTFDQVMALAMPAIQALVGISFAASVYLAVAHRFRLLPDTWWLVLVFYTVGFGSMVLGCSTRYGRSPSAILKGLLLANVYVPYTWTIWPVLARASYRHLRHRTGWDKTEREVVSEPT